MSPEEALARLRRELAFAQEHAQWPSVHRRDLRALLDAYDAARAEGVAAERARVVADLRAEAKALREMRFCACGCEMTLADALRERKNGYLNDEQAESLMPVRVGSARTNAEASALELRADRYERGDHDKEGT